MESDDQLTAVDPLKPKQVAPDDGAPPRSGDVESSLVETVDGDAIAPKLPPESSIVDALRPLFWDPTGELAQSVREAKRADSGLLPIPELSPDEEFATEIWRGKAPILGRNVEDRTALIGERYEIIEPLGVGGMGKVFRVRHVNMDKEFAVKIIHANLSGDVHIINRFFSEARVASAVDHPNVVQIIDFGVDAERGAYIVMELLKGETLEERLSQEAPLKLHRALDIALQTAEALHFMHQHELIHCDVKPENVFLCRAPSGRRRKATVKIIDFGLSRQHAEGTLLSPEEVAGTPGFMAPEQIRRSAPVPSMDIYALGVLLYQCVTGKLPFDGTTQEILTAKCSQEPPPPSSLLDEPLDQLLEELIMKALAREPEQRHASMGQLVYQLRTVLEMMGFPHRGSTGSAMKAVDRSAAPPSQSDQETRVLLQYCPCPLFLLDKNGIMRRMNRAFERFVQVPAAELAGRDVSDTRLGHVIPGFREDLEALWASSSPRPFSRLLSFAVGQSAEDKVSAMLLLVPRVDRDGAVTHYSGVIHYVGGDIPPLESAS